MELPFLYCCATFVLIIINLTYSLRCPELTVRFGRVKYRSRGRVATFGCWGGYTLYGDKYAGCFRGLWDVKSPKCVKSGCSDEKLDFGSVRKPLVSTAVLAFRCFEGYDLVGPKEIYCDGTSFDALPPICKRSEMNMACDFENNNMCKWRSDRLQNLTFQLINTAPPSRMLNTGPDHDHTLEPNINGYYIYLETSSTIPGEVARIVTPSYLPHAEDDNTCFKFWYHIYGQTIGALRVYINSTVVFEKKENRGDRWRLGKVKLPTQSHFKIIVEAVTGRGYLGDIALDDFDIGECSNSGGETCVDRCSEDEHDPFAGCNCHPGCVEELSCCNDYVNLCVAKTTTGFADVITASSEPSTTALDENLTSFPTIIYTEDENNDGYYDIQTVDYVTETESVTEPLIESDINHSQSKSTGNENVFTDIQELTDSYLSVTFDALTTDAIENNSEESVTQMSLNEITEKVSNKPTKEIPVAITTEKISNDSDGTTRYNLRPRLTTIVNLTTVTARPTTLSSPRTKPKQTVTTLLPTRRTTSKPTLAKTTTSSFNNRTKSLEVLTTLHTKSSTVTTTTTLKPTPIEHRPVTVSMKDPKITSRSFPNSFNLTTQVPRIDIKIDDSNDTLMTSYGDINPVTDPATDLQNQTIRMNKWKSIYKKKGAFKLIDNAETKEETVNSTGVTSFVLIFIILAVGLTVAVILFLRKRRLSSGPSDGADIVFIPADELLDFTPATGGANRDSGVYSDTVMSIKRDKGFKS